MAYHCKVEPQEHSVESTHLGLEKWHSPLRAQFYWFYAMLRTHKYIRLTISRHGGDTQRYDVMWWCYSTEYAASECCKLSNRIECEWMLRLTATHDESCAWYHRYYFLFTKCKWINNEWTAIWCFRFHFNPSVWSRDAIECVFVLMIWSCVHSIYYCFGAHVYSNRSVVPIAIEYIPLWQINYTSYGFFTFQVEVNDFLFFFFVSS